MGKLRVSYGNQFFQKTGEKRTKQEEKGENKKRDGGGIFVFHHLFGKISKMAGHVRGQSFQCQKPRNVD